MRMFGGSDDPPEDDNPGTIASVWRARDRDYPSIDRTSEYRAALEKIANLCPDFDGEDICKILASVGIEVSA